MTSVDVERVDVAAVVDERGPPVEHGEQPVLILLFLLEVGEPYGDGYTDFFRLLYADTR